MSTMGKGRLEAFSDGVLAILITIMVLEMHAPHGGSIADLRPLFPVFLAYLLSFVYLGIYWNNHHHLLHAARGIDAGVMWANLHLLFWLSLVPFVTAWLGQSPGPVPSGVYGSVLLMAAVAYYVLQRVITRQEPPESPLVKALGRDAKGKLSLVIYASGIVLGFWRAWAAWVLYVLVALIWLVPDRRLTVKPS